MRNGYKILWTNHALNELEKIFEYLEINFSEKELKRLAQKIESITSIIAQNPKLFPLSDKKEIYRVSILKFNTMYYRVRNDKVEILSFFSNRQSPKKRKL